MHSLAALLQTVATQHANVHASASQMPSPAYLLAVGVVESAFRGDDNDFKHTTAIFGIILAVSAAALGTCSKQLLATSAKEQQFRWMLYVGSFLNMIIGPVMDAAAYAFAPAIIVAPLASLGIIFSILTAPYTMDWQGEQLTVWHYLGVACVAAGSTCTALIAIGREEKKYTTLETLNDRFTHPTAVAYIVTEAVVGALMLDALRKDRISPRIRGPCIGMLAGMLVGNVYLVQGFTGLLRYTWDKGHGGPWCTVTPYFLAFAALGIALAGNYFLTKGVREFNYVYMVVFYEGAHIMSACASGAIVMKEMRNLSFISCVFYWMSLGFVVLGLTIVQKEVAEAELKVQTHYLEEKKAEDIAKERARDELQDRKISIDRPG